LDFDDKFNKDLLKEDEDICTKAKILKGKLLRYKEKGSMRRYKDSLGYSKEFECKVREVLKAH